MPQEGRFTDKQLKDLAKSGIDIQAALACGLRCEESPISIKAMLGCGDGVRLTPALVFPYFPRGDKTKEPMFVRLKPDEPFTDQQGPCSRRQRAAWPRDQQRRGTAHPFR